MRTYPIPTWPSHSGNLPIFRFVSSDSLLTRVLRELCILSYGERWNARLFREWTDCSLFPCDDGAIHTRTWYKRAHFFYPKTRVWWLEAAFGPALLMPFSFLGIPDAYLLRSDVCSYISTFFSLYTDVGRGRMEALHVEMLVATINSPLSLSLVTAKRKP